MMWFSSGDTKSVTHTDDYENILCVFSGVKELVLVDYYKFKNLINVSFFLIKGEMVLFHYLTLTDGRNIFSFLFPKYFELKSVSKIDRF